MIQGVIFDIDGTLLDSMPIWDEVGSRYIKSQGMIPEDGLSQKLFPMSMEESASYFQTRYHINQSIQEIIDGVFSIIRDFYLHEVKLKAGATELLARLHNMNIPMILATSGDKELAMAALKRLNVLSYFQGILTVDVLHTSKREPVIFLEAARLLGTKPAETLVLEDVKYALETAKKAGFITAAVCDEASQKDYPWMKENADYFLDSLNELKI